MKWTDGMLAQLRELWGKDTKAKDIAAKIGGITRNAVIGKAHRMKLPVLKQTVQKQKPAMIHIRDKNRILINPVIIPVAPIVEEVPVHNEGVSLLNKGKDQCCAVITPEGIPSADLRYCGNRIKKKTSYCDFHYAKYYMPLRPRLVSDTTR